jgi:hypothetical protein
MPLLAQRVVVGSREPMPPSKGNPSYSEHEFCTAVETAFMQWESLQNAGLLVPDMFAHSQAAAIISLPAPASAEVPRNP